MYGPLLRVVWFFGHALLEMLSMIDYSHASMVLIDFSNVAHLRLIGMPAPGAVKQVDLGQRRGRGPIMLMRNTNMM